MAKGNLSKTYHGKGRADEETLESIRLHLSDKNNPHEATAEQVGAVKKSEVEAHVLGLNKRINEVDSKYNTETANIRTVTQQAIDTIGKIVNSKADSDHTHTADEVGAYTKAEIDEKFNNLYYTEDVKLTDVTALVSMGIPGELIKDDVLIPVGAGGLAMETLFHIDVNGYIKFHCEIEEGGSSSEINGTLIGGETGIYEYSFEGEVTGGFDVMLTSSSVTFTEFVKKTYVKDAISNKSDIGHGHIASEIDGVYSSEEVDNLLEDPHYCEDINLVSVTTSEGGTPTITENSLSSDGSTFYINVSGHIKFRCEVDENGGFATVMGTEIGGNTGVYEYSFEGEVEKGFTVYCSFVGVTFKEFVKTAYLKDEVGEIKDSIGDIDSALDAILAIQAEYIGGDEV